MSRLNFNAIVFTNNVALGNKGFITYHKQDSFVRFFRFVRTTFPTWKFVTVYIKPSNEEFLIRESFMQLDIDNMLNALRK